MAAFLDVCRFTPTLGGTTDWTVSAAVTGYQTPASAGAVNGTVYRYRAESADLTQWEVGYGAYTVSGTVLARTTVLFNSSGTTSKINFTATPQVAVVALKEDLISVEEANSFTVAQQSQARVNIYAAPFDALAYNGMQTNGSCDVSQFNGTTAVALASGTSAYVIDGWDATFVRAATLAISCQQITPPGSPSFQNAFQNCLQIKATAGLVTLATGDYGYLEHLIEGYRVQRLGFGQSNAQSVTIGFWVYATIAGTMTVAVSNNLTNRTYPSNVVINSPLTWEYKTITITGDVTGTWEVGNLIGMRVRFCFGAGASVQATNNAWGAGGAVGTSATTNFFATTNNVACVTGLVVVPGTEAPSASRSPFIMRPFDQELTLAQRHYSKSFAYGTVPANNIVGDEYAAFAFNTAGMNTQRIFFPSRMRAAPTMTFYSSNNKATPTAGQWQYFNGASWVDITSMAIASSGSDINDTAFVAALIATVTATAGYICGGGWAASARL